MLSTDWGTGAEQLSNHQHQGEFPEAGRRGRGRSVRHRGRRRAEPAPVQEFDQIAGAEVSDANPGGAAKEDQGGRAFTAGVPKAAAGVLQPAAGEPGPVRVAESLGGAGDSVERAWAAVLSGPEHRFVFEARGEAESVGAAATVLRLRFPAPRAW